MTTFAAAVSLETLQCWGGEKGECGVSFAIPWYTLQAMKNNGFVVTCPHGHRIRWGKSEMDKLREELESAKGERDRWMSRTQEEIRSKRAIQGAMTKVKARVGRGVCPCCNRHFSNVERHMHSKHPDFKAPEPS